jgi:hypothetical protein
MIEYGILSRQFIEKTSLIATDWRLALPESSAFLDKEMLHMNEEEKNRILLYMQGTDDDKVRCALILISNHYTSVNASIEDIKNYIADISI